MDGYHTPDEYEALQLQVENLRRQNEILRMENKLRGFRKDLEDYSGLMSTPTPGKPEPGWGPRRYGLRFQRVDLTFRMVLTRKHRKS